MLDDGDLRDTGLNRQRTAMVGSFRASRTAMMLPQTLGSEVSHAAEQKQGGWTMMRAASGARSTVQSFLGLS